MSEYVTIQTAQQLLGKVKRPVKAPEADRDPGNLWIIRCPKSKRKVHLYTDIERDYWLLLIWNPDVDWLCEQPLKVTWTVDDVDVGTIFDVLIRWVDGRFSLREVKYADTIDPETISTRTRRQLEAQLRWCTLHQVDYDVVKEDTVYSNMLLVRNLRQMTPYLRVPPGQQAMELMAEIVVRIKSVGEMTLGDIESFAPIGLRQALRRAVLRKLFLHELTAPYDNQPFGNNLLIRLPGSG